MFVTATTTTASATMATTSPRAALTGRGTSNSSRHEALNRLACRGREPPLHRRAGSRAHWGPLGYRSRLETSRNNNNRMMFTFRAPSTNPSGSDNPIDDLDSDDLPSPGTEALIFNAPVFALSTVHHPGTAGLLNVFEPRYLEMFSDLERDCPEGRKAKFVHVLSAMSAPEALDDIVGSVTRIGVLCAVRHIERTPDGRMMVEYEGLRRVSLASVVKRTPYMVAVVEWLTDEAIAEGKEQQLATLEKDVWRTLLEIDQLTRALSKKKGPKASSGLPPLMGKYAPNLDDSSLSSVDYLMQSGDKAGKSISQWMRSGSNSGSAPKSKSGSAGRSVDDPYKAVKESLSPHRSEFFSFAAAGLLEMGKPERLALLRSQDTAGRLQWVYAAVQPYLQELRAKQSLQKTLSEDS